ncbi:hypothetical protein UFOVP678_27 [uncultured Caudovirales phage]|uniref:Uncharacterized protein n=1 Tax=uncultured Caudovirales phage TaxID=2100421 RepID=A0A6J5NJ34_9CAUD|nr:hypothetical protein UFOVP678_27 [uncultured Caudovirales phage]
MIRDVIFVGVFALGVVCGWVANQVDFDHAGCDDYSGKYQRYEAWLSVRDGVYRCFWVETQYPHRVKMQGVIDVK